MVLNKRLLMLSRPWVRKILQESKSNLKNFLFSFVFCANKGENGRRKEKPGKGREKKLRGRQDIPRKGDKKIGDFSNGRDKESL
jgi:hypothetical protein